eukprot:TRINITY_DN5066_c0_g1_i1.p2 TRINITY_DN5066_c0_g1~~TRINITY_DN5066_c0_g1_i1.p2  ORF type:complete len:745 (-),score=157.75 TRINITY_DN5066_c0_g1_i1:3061-5295(-)
MSSRRENLNANRMDKDLIYADEPFEAERETNVVLATTIAGHPGLIPKAARILKPVQPNDMEAKAYARIQADYPQLLPFMPSFFGVKVSPKRDAQYIVLENLLHGCKRPAVMDLKIGKSLHIREDPLRQGVYNLLGMFIHGVESSFLRCRNRVNEYVGRQVTIDDFDQIIRLFFRRMGPNQEFVDRIMALIRELKKLNGVRFYGTSLLIVFDEDDPDRKPTAHLIDFERVRIDDRTDGSGMDKMPQEEVNRLFRVHVNAKKNSAEPDKEGSAAGGPVGNIRNETDQQFVDSAMLRNSGPDQYIIRSLRYFLAIIQEEWSYPARLYNPGCHPSSLQYYIERDQTKLKPVTPRPPMVYFVRHGERYDYTDFEWAKKAAFPHDSHLSSVGATQAEDLADRIPHARPALLVSSPFQRALLSAVPLARRLRIPICVEPGLAEFLCKDTRTRTPGWFSSEVTVSPWVDQAYKPFWPELKLETWDAMRLRVAYTVCNLIKKCTEMGGDLIIVSHRSTLTAAFEWLDEAHHPNARLEYGGLAVLAKRSWEGDHDTEHEHTPSSSPSHSPALSHSTTHNGTSEHQKHSTAHTTSTTTTSTTANHTTGDDLTSDGHLIAIPDDLEKNEAAREFAEAARGQFFFVSFNEVQHLRNHILSPSSNPFRHIEGYYEDLSWDNYKKSVPKASGGAGAAVVSATAAALAGAAGAATAAGAGPGVVTTVTASISVVTTSTNNNSSNNSNSSSNSSSSSSDKK